VKKINIQAEVKNKLNSDLNPEAHIKLIVSRKRFIIKFSALFFVLGITYSFILENLYTASVSFIPKSSQSISAGSGFAELTSYLGVDFNSPAQIDNGIPPGIYPKILYSKSFRKNLLNSYITINEDGDQVAYKEYYDNHYLSSSLGKIRKFVLELPFKISNKINTRTKSEQNESKIKEFVSISNDEIIHIKGLEDNIKLRVFEDGYVFISVTMPDPLVATEMLQNVLNLLQNDILSYKLNNAIIYLNFVEEKYLEKKMAYELSLEKLSSFVDNYQNLNSELAQNVIRNLEAENSLEFSLYNELAKQLEYARFELNERTPVFYNIDDISVPVNKSRPSRLLITMTFTFLGAILSLFLLHIKLHMKTMYANYRR
jgi:hypothetical protein